MGEEADRLVDEMLDRHMFIKRGRHTSRPPKPLQPLPDYNYPISNLKEKEKEMTTPANNPENSNLLLALEVQKGLHLYRVCFKRIKTPNESDLYTYCSYEPIEPDTFVLVPTNNGTEFKLAKMIREEFNITFNYAYTVQPILCQLPDPEKLYASWSKRQQDAMRRLIEVQMKKRVKEYLGDLSEMGLDGILEGPTAPTRDEVRYEAAMERERQRYEAEDEADPLDMPAARAKGDEDF